MALLFVWRLAKSPHFFQTVLQTNGHTHDLRKIIMRIIF
ncbi:hypothetical protein EMIT0P100_10532 [Pseudomonas sp. IT-P100]